MPKTTTTNKKKIEPMPLYTVCNANDEPKPVLPQKSVAEVVAEYGAGNSIPDLLRAILTELVRARIGG